MTDACILNNQAAFLIENNECEQSIELLQKALVLTRTTMTAFETSGSSMDTTTTTTTTPTSNSAEEGSHGQQQRQPNETTSTCSRREDFCRFLAPSSRLGGESSLDSCFLKAGPAVAPSPSSPQAAAEDRQQQQHSMFGSPLLFSSAVQLSDQRSLECFSYVVIYNLALAMHRMAIQLATSSYHDPQGQAAVAQQEQQVVHYRQKALMLYEKAYCLLSRVCAAATATKTADEINNNLSVLHSLAILCNLGHVHHIMGNKTHSDGCYQRLLTAICFVVDSRRGARGGNTFSSSSASLQRGTGHDGDDSYLTRDLLDGFFDNVMPILQKKGKVAAAA